MFDLRKVIVGTLATAITAGSVVSTFAADNKPTPKEYTFPDKGDVSVKIETLPKEKDTDPTLYLVSVGLRTQEGESISHMEGSVKVDPTVFDMSDLQKNLSTNFVKWDIFTSSSNEISPENLKNGVLTFQGTTDVGFNSSTATDAFSVVLKARTDNKQPTSTVTVSSDSFKIVDLKKDPQKNLFSGKVEDTIENLPVSTTTTSVDTTTTSTGTTETVTTPTVVETPVVTAPPVVETPVKVETPVVTDTTNKVHTGVTENILVLILALGVLGGTFYVNRKSA